MIFYLSCFFSFFFLCLWESNYDTFFLTNAEVQIYQKSDNCISNFNSFSFDAYFWRTWENDQALIMTRNTFVKRRSDPLSDQWPPSDWSPFSFARLNLPKSDSWGFFNNLKYHHYTLIYILGIFLCIEIIFCVDFWLICRIGIALDDPIWI